MGVRLWHDDVRPAPEGWEWARTNEAAKIILAKGDVIECSLDHDLGHHTVNPLDLTADVLLVGIPPKFGSDTGLHLVDWMIENDLVPERVTIHSWNPGGARNMAARLAQFGHSCEVRPYAL